MDEQDKPKCRFCGEVGFVRQVPAPVPCSDCYCDKQECVDKCYDMYCPEFLRTPQVIKMDDPIN